MMAKHDNASILRRGEQQASIAIAFLVLAWLFIALRVWTRTFLIANFGWDDSTMILAGLIYTVYCAAMMYLQANGGGTHITSVAEMVDLTKWVIVGEATYLLTVMVLKISLGIFFARIVINRWQLLIIYIAVGINIVSSMASFFYVLLRCGPNLNQYVYRQLEWKCTPRALDRFFAYQSASVTTLTDCVFAVLPIAILWHAQMDKRSKFSIGFILSLAALGCVCSMIRFQYVDGLTQIDDFFWNAASIAIWSTIEPGTGIIAGCLATVRPLVKSFVTMARSIRLSSSRSTREPSHSFGSNNTKSTKDSSIKKTTTVFHHESELETYNEHNCALEFKPDERRKDDSMDETLLRTDTFYGATSEPDQDLLVEQDSRSSRSAHARRSRPTTRERPTLQPSSTRKPLPRLPPERSDEIC